MKNRQLHFKNYKMLML